MNSLSKIVNVLGSVAGNGYPCYFEGPDGKRYFIKQVVNTRTISNEVDEIETIIKLEPVDHAVLFTSIDHAKG